MNSYVKFEKERKFLVRDSSVWRGNVSNTVHIRQLFLPREEGKPLQRVRIEKSAELGTEAFLIHKERKSTHRGVRVTLERIDVDVAEQMLEQAKNEGRFDMRYIEKTRHFLDIPSNGKWCVDEFHGKLEGLQIAEHEVIAGQASLRPYHQPSWAVADISKDKRYDNHWLASQGRPAPAVLPLQSRHEWRAFIERGQDNSRCR